MKAAPVTEAMAWEEAGKKLWGESPEPFGRTLRQEPAGETAGLLPRIGDFPLGLLGQDEVRKMVKLSLSFVSAVL